MEMINVRLTEQQRINLDKLAFYLENLPDSYESFHMGSYFTVMTAATWSKEKEIEAKYARENGGVGKCGAIACAVGHGPSAGILFSEEEASLLPIDSVGGWNKYCSNNFCTTNTPEWCWAFSGGWSHIDNTPEGAAKRIRYMLRHAEIPLVQAFSNPLREFVELYQGEF